MRRLTTAACLVVAGIVIFLFLRNAGSILVIDEPKTSDVLVVLNGDQNDRRYYRGLELLAEGMAGSMLVDGRTDVIKYGHTDAEQLARFIDESAGPQKEKVHVCPITGNSTLLESVSLGKCLQDSHAYSVLLVTSDFHTRRGLSVLEHTLPGYRWSVATAYDPDVFGVRWWTKREWAKTTLLEWQKLIWWYAVDRWKKS